MPKRNVNRRTRRTNVRRRKRITRKRKTRMPRMLRPKIMSFKRDIEETLILSTATPPDGWSTSGNRLYRNLQWAFANLGDSSDFSRLFKQYKINGAKMKLYFSNTNSDQQGATNAFSNSQLLVRMTGNQIGAADVLDNSFWQSTMAKQYRTALNGGKPISIYMPLKIQSVLNQSTGTGTALTSPRWIDSQPINQTVPHSGLSMSFERVDGQAFTTGASNHQYVKIITTLYFSMRKVE